MQGLEVGISNIGAQGNITLLKVKGYVDTTTSTELYGTLSKLLNDGHLLFVVDMGGVNYVSSAGWGVFVGEIKGIREQGGDLKIVQMTPDVYEVFAMLEFNKILDYYETMEESINDFDISLGYDITKSIARKAMAQPQSDVSISPPPLKSTTRENETQPAGATKKWTAKVKRAINEANLPVVEKIKIIIIDDPNIGMMQIRKTLDTERFGFQKISILKLRSTLKQYNLETREKRHRFYRSR
ncbi:STAS domain-containing protein [candidate division KSB1 bacterium]|nr:STAS domain-containing protein [candidate division KSB1 bacterium]